MRPFIVIGDKTDHGGVVVQGSPSSDAYGKAVARVGDQVTCPRRGHGLTTIVTGDPTMIVDGRPAARHGDKCACGAMLLSSQALAAIIEGSSAAAAASTSRPEGSLTSAGRTLFPFDEQVELLTNTAFAEGLPYAIKTGGRMLFGRVGPDHRLPRIDTSSEDAYEVVVGDEALALIEGVQA